MIRITFKDRLTMIGHAIDGLPDEACGLLAAQAGDETVQAVYPCRNAAESARLYEVHPLDHLKADRDADGRGLQIAGVYHSHTHTPAYPSPTDVAQAPDPDWHYVLISLAGSEPDLRSFSIRDGEVSEEPVVIEDR